MGSVSRKAWHSARKACSLSRGIAAVCLLLLTTGGCDVPFEVDVLVRDSQGAPIPEARVSVRYSDKGDERTFCSTGSAGKCRASTITGFGHFNVFITKEGYKPAALEVPTSTESRLNATLESLSSPRSSHAELVPGELERE